MDSENSQQKIQPLNTLSTRANKYCRFLNRATQSKPSGLIKKGRPLKRIKKIKTCKTLSQLYCDKFYKSFLQFVKINKGKYYNKSIYKEKILDKEFEFIGKNQKIKLSQADNKLLQNLVKSKMISKQAQLQLEKMLINIKWIFLSWKQEISNLMLQILWMKKEDQEWSKKFANQIISKKKFENILQFLFIRYTKQEKKEKKEAIEQGFSKWLIKLYQLIKQMLESIVKKQEIQNDSQNHEDQQNQQENLNQQQDEQQIDEQQDQIQCKQQQVQ